MVKSLKKKYLCKVKTPQKIAVKKKKDFPHHKLDRKKSYKTIFAPITFLMIMSNLTICIANLDEL